MCLRICSGSHFHSDLSYFLKKSKNHCTQLFIQEPFSSASLLYSSFKLSCVSYRTLELILPPTLLVMLPILLVLQPVLFALLPILLAVLVILYSHFCLYSSLYLAHLTAYMYLACHDVDHACAAPCYIHPSGPQKLSI